MDALTTSTWCLNPSVNHRKEWQDKPDDFTEIQNVDSTFMIRIEEVFLEDFSVRLFY